MTKGPDESRVAVVPEKLQNNEIESYVTKRYIGSNDAAWRTLEFDVTAREPNVKQLSVHLADQQSVYFRQGTEAVVAQQGDKSELDRLTYLDFYEKFLTHAKRPPTKCAIFETSNNKFITKRQRSELIARVKTPYHNTILVNAGPPKAPA